ncbi:signal transduction histidine kinase [Neorhizobium huautlense]|uniref:histidine kinase n=1 Tax=Neorhizobium huautlense TaxID=67774 RepID=A0ABT9PZ38_9HYPH|nr:ATP-binding protein [Neorhizobium huautlense]MDP9839755.1 signal transduction histidine kinase [Neorhizobium huautlense]
MSLAAIGLLVVYQYASGLSDLSERTRSMEMLLAERLAQHDAHLSGLGAVVRMSPDEPSTSIQGLAENIITRYPRITDITTITIGDEITRAVSYGRPQGPEITDLQPKLDLTGLEKIGDTSARPAATPHSYEIFKLVAPKRLLRLRIDTDALLDMGDDGVEYSSMLSLNGTVLFETSRGTGALLTASNALDTSNYSQPLHLTVSRGFRLNELSPPHLALLLLAALAAITWLIMRYRHASRERQSQERRALLFEQEAKLAQAGRVNAMGEMASGIAHELAQPIAAMLSQSQAAKRALAIDRPDILETAIDANIRDARRAGDILARMRAYVSGAPARIEDVPLAEAVTDALRLVEADIAQRGITLVVTQSDEVGTGCIDVISFQQVLHNLVRNAADAMAGRQDPTITVDVRRLRDEVLVIVADNGPGIDPSSLGRIFDPFFTTKTDGMGLGLPLCARLLEKMNGSIEVCNDGGARFTIHLPTGALR